MPAPVTHALLWWLDGDRRLSLKARRAIASQSNTILVSTASAEHDNEVIPVE
jgi:PIN domain nuclease of toxin-antitoxin system